MDYEKLLFNVYVAIVLTGGLFYVTTEATMFTPFAITIHAVVLDKLKWEV